ncbi:12936_t:CDS:2 [Funneliformis mosseae]|uniref:12936_t:CDS:1 n=1 Tax=Funneliformis mosseae TaxID=27381 RepID=A0A9N9B9Z9_FUNMO|nr:12936_t:CDS:2 [Funneliformis mosseae]
MCLQNDSLNSSHYVSVSEIFNDLLYKSSVAKLKLMTDIDEYLIVKKDIHEEILRKVDPEEIPNIQNIASDVKIGYILEVDLEILVHLHTTLQIIH